MITKQDGGWLEAGENKTSYSNGDDYLTTRRIIWSGKGSEITLFLHLVALAQEEEGEFMKTDKIILHLMEPAYNSSGCSALRECYSESNQNCLAIFSLFLMASFLTKLSDFD